MKRASCAARPPRASSCPMSAAAWARAPDGRAAARSSFLKSARFARCQARRLPRCSGGLVTLTSMPKSKRLTLLAALALVASVACGVYSCAHTQLVGGTQTVPGAGPGGKPMRTVTGSGGRHAAGRRITRSTRSPRASRSTTTTSAPRSPIPTAGSRTSTPRPCSAWVTAQNALSQPRLAGLPQRAWLKARLTQLWNYERYELPVKRGGHYFYLHNDGKQNQSVLLVADTPRRPRARAV